MLYPSVVLCVFCGNFIDLNVVATDDTEEH